MAPRSGWHGRVFCVVSVVFALWAGAAAAQMPSGAQIDAAPSVPGITVREDWQVVCMPDGCRAEPRQPSAPGISLTVVTEGQGQVLVLRTPLGLLLGEGVAVSVDDRAMGRLAFLTCEIDGCVAPVRIDGALRRALRGGMTLDLAFRGRDSEVIAAEYSLLGFIAATDLLQGGISDSSTTD